MAAAVADLQAEPRADAGPDRDHQQRAGIACLEPWPLAWARPTAPTQKPTAMTVAAVISLNEGLRSSMPKKVMAEERVEGRVIA